MTMKPACAPSIKHLNASQHTHVGTFSMHLICTTMLIKLGGCAQWQCPAHHLDLSCRHWFLPEACAGIYQIAHLKISKISRFLAFTAFSCQVPWQCFEQICPTKCRNPTKAKTSREVHICCSNVAATHFVHTVQLTDSCRHMQLPLPIIGSYKRERCCSNCATL